MTPEDLGFLADVIVSRESEAERLAAHIKEIEAKAGIPELKAERASLEADADAVRESLGAWYAEQHAAWLACLEAGVESPLPELPPQLTFQKRTVLMAKEPDLIPREACVPKQSLLKDGMPGVVSEQRWSPRITATKA